MADSSNKNVIKFKTKEQREKERKFEEAKKRVLEHAKSLDW